MRPVRELWGSRVLEGSHPALLFQQQRQRAVASIAAALDRGSSRRKLKKHLESWHRQHQVQWCTPGELLAAAQKLQKQQKRQKQQQQQPEEQQQEKQQQHQEQMEERRPERPSEIKEVQEGQQRVCEQECAVQQHVVRQDEHLEGLQPGDADDGVGENNGIQGVTGSGEGDAVGGSPSSSSSDKSSATSDSSVSADSDSCSSCSSKSSGGVESELCLVSPLLLEVGTGPVSYPVEMCSEEEEEEQEEVGPGAGDLGQASGTEAAASRLQGANSSRTSNTAWTVSDLLSLSADAIRPVRYEDFEAALQNVSNTEFDLSDKYTEWSQRFGSGGGLKRDAGWKSLPMYI